MGGSLEDRLERLARLREGDLDEGAVADLRSALRSGNNALVAAGAEATARCHATECVEELVSAFDRSMDAPGRDKGCLGKTAVVRALNRLGHDGADLFLRGAGHVQMEPVYGGQEDAAPDLRCECAVALVRTGHPDLFRVLTDLLFDSEPGPRRTAVEALRRLGGAESELLLRARALAGDAETSVTGNCFLALLGLDPCAALPFVARFLDADAAAVAEEAALALGESRRPEALELLRSRWDASVRAEEKDRLLLPIALTRQEEAFEFLLRLVREAPQERAVAAVEALHLYDNGGERRRRVERAVRERNAAAVTRACRQTFNPR
ncbi:MAG: HEAT repeat domain-containing protein [Candidatus Brocadiaceae bacterium]|jgi:hypothetical protein